MKYKNFELIKLLKYLNFKIVNNGNYYKEYHNKSCYIYIKTLTISLREKNINGYFETKTYIEHFNENEIIDIIKKEFKYELRKIKIKKLI